MAVPKTKLKHSELLMIADCVIAILRTIDTMHPTPVPASGLFAALSKRGCTLEIFTAIMNQLVKDQFLVRNGADYNLGVKSLATEDEVAFSE